MVVLRKHQNYEQPIFYQNQRLHNVLDQTKCLDVWAGRDAENQPLTYWPCHGGNNQKWRIKYYTKPNWHNVGFKHGQRFRIQSRMQGNRVFYVDNHIGGNQHRITLRMSGSSNRDQFYYDATYGNIRWLPNGGYVLSLQAGPLQRGRNLVIGPYRNDQTQKFQYVPGKFHNLHMFYSQDLCADISWGKNEFNTPIIVWSCHNGVNQQWDLVDLNH